MERRFERIEALLEKQEARAQKSDARFEKRMRGFEKLAEIGMKEIAQSRRLHRQMDEKLNALIDAQQRTEAGLAGVQASLRQFINSLRKGPNGN